MKKTIDMFNAKEATAVRYNLKDTLLKGITFSTGNQKNDSDENELDVVVQANSIYYFKFTTSKCFMPFQK
jgi:hypothetical protein